MPVDDSLWSDHNLSALGAQSKRPGLQADAPAQQPMRSGIPAAQRRAPSTDQKKVRRQMAKSAASTGEFPACPSCGSTDSTPFTDGTYQGYAKCGSCGAAFDQSGQTVAPKGTFASKSITSSTKESTTMHETTEADLLAKMASATTFHEQQHYANALEEIRNARREQIAAESSLDWDGMAQAPVASQRIHLAPMTASLGTSQGGGLWESLETPTHTDDEITTAMRAEATLWYDGLISMAKADDTALSGLAYNAASRAATAFGPQAPGASSVFLSTVAHLHRKATGSKIAFDEVQKPPYGVQSDTEIADGNSATFDGLVNGEDTADSGRPKTDTSMTPSLSEGTSPEGDQASEQEGNLADDNAHDNAQGTGYTDPLPTGGKSSSFHRHAEDPKSTSFSTPSTEEGDTPEGDHAEPAVTTPPGPEDHSSWDSAGKDYLDGTTANPNRTRAASLRSLARKVLTEASRGSNEFVFGQGLVRCSSMSDSLGGITARQMVEILTRSASLSPDTRASLRRILAEEDGSNTCAVCGDKIAKDPNGEEPSTWHHDNGEKHDHEAKPGGSKESRRTAASDEYQRGYEQGKKDHTEETSLGDKKETDTWENASEEWKRGWGDGYEAAALDKESSRRTAASDTGTCATCGRGISYDKDSRKWSHDNEGPDTDHEAKPQGKESARRTAGEYDPNFDPRNTMTAPIGSPEWEKIMYEWGYSKGKNEPGLDWGGVNYRHHPGPFARGFRDAVDDKGSRTASEYKGGSPKQGDTATCHADGKPIEFFDGQWMHYANGPSHNDVYPATPREQAEKESSRHHAVSGDDATVATCSCGFSTSDDMLWQKHIFESDTSNAFREGHERVSSRKTASRPLYEIARDIKRNWPDVYFGAKPYLDALSQLSTMDDRYFEDDASTIVAYLVSNMRYFRGPEAARLKQELKDLQAEHKRSRRASLDHRVHLASSPHTAISVTNVGIDKDGNGTGTTSDGTRVTFRLTEQDRADLKAVLYSDLAVNFSGVDIDQSDILTEQGGGNSMTGPSRQAVRVAPGFAQRVQAGLGKQADASEEFYLTTGMKGYGGEIVSGPHSYAEAKELLRTHETATNLMQGSHPLLPEKKTASRRTAAQHPGGAWKAQVAGTGEMVWSENALRFDTPEEAKAYIGDLSMRWFGFDLGRVVPADTPNREPVDLSDPQITHNFR